MAETPQVAAVSPDLRKAAPALHKALEEIEEKLPATWSTLEAKMRAKLAFEADCGPALRLLRVLAG